MKKINVLTVLLLILTFMACQKKEAQKTNSTSTEKIATESQIPSVSLNNGQLWEANPETTSGIKTLHTLILASKPEESAAVLQEKLNAEFAIIFKKCTMTGEAHDQLHNYLLPLKHRINAIEDTNKGDLKKEIATYLEQYGSYFK